MSEVILETRGYCLSCLKKPVPAEVGEGNGELELEVMSLEKICTYLKISKGQVYATKKGAMLKALEKTKLNGSVCNGCGDVLEKMMGIMEEIEELQMKLAWWAKTMEYRMKDGDSLEEFQDEMMGDPEAFTHFWPVDGLRDQMIAECEKLASKMPRVTLAKMHGYNRANDLGVTSEDGEDDLDGNNSGMSSSSSSTSDLTSDAGTENGRQQNPVVVQEDVEEEMGQEEEEMDDGEVDDSSPIQVDPASDRPEAENREEFAEAFKKRLRRAVQLVHQQNDQKASQGKDSGSDMAGKKNKVGVKTKARKFPKLSLAKVLKARKTTAKYSLKSKPKSRSRQATSRVNCDLCPKTYTDRRSLQRHKSAVHEGIRYSCDLCDKSFTENYHLNKHKKKCH